MLESWSARENLASLSLGVIKSNFLKSVMFPHLVATWLSAALKIFFFIEETKKGIDAKVILAGRDTNNQMTEFVKKLVINNLKLKKINISKSKILLLGLTYKKNVADIRNSLSIKVFQSLKKHLKRLNCFDPFIDNKFKKKYKLIDKNKIRKFYVYVFLTNHDEFRK